MEREKKECILTAAARAFTRFGFKKTSVDEIARDAGVAKGTVYLACESKEDLFYQSINRELRAWIAEAGKMIDPRVAAEELLARTSVFGVQFLEERPLVRDLFAGKYQALLPHWSDRFDELRAAGRANVEQILRLGMRQGRFREDLDVETVATILQDVQMATYIFHNRDDAQRPERLERRLRVGMDLVVKGLRVAPAAERVAEGHAPKKTDRSHA